MVDDAELDRAMFARLLRDARLANPLRAFAHGEDLIDALIGILRGAPPPVCCFVDVKMTGMSGFDVLRWIRCQSALDIVPVVMLSSSEAPHDLSEALYHGAQCYTAKFPTADHLRAIVDEAEAMAAAVPGRPFRLPCNLLLPSAQPVS